MHYATMCKCIHMKKYVALLRGINVGGNKKVSMQLLKTAFEKLGSSDVATYINSGNVIFNSSETDENKLLHTIEKELEDVFGFSIRVVLRDADNIQKLAHKIPSNWKNDSEMKTDVLFLWEAFDTKDSISYLNAQKDVDMILYIDGALVWHIMRKNYSKSAMHSFIGTPLYKNMTARNVNTVRKLAELMG